MAMPSIGVERLRLVAKVQKRKRKLTTIMNEQMKERLDSYTSMLDRQCSMVDLKSQRHAIPIQRSLIDTRSYALALAERGEQNLRKCRSLGSLEELQPYGLYEGATHRVLKYDIERIKYEYRPEKVRARKAEKLVKEGTRKGKIMPQHEVPYKFHDLMTRKYDAEKGRFVTRGSNQRAGLDSRGMSLPPISADRSLVTQTDAKGLGLRRAVTYFGP